MAHKFHCNVMPSYMVHVSVMVNILSIVSKNMIFKLPAAVEGVWRNAVVEVLVVVVA